MNTIIANTSALQPMAEGRLRRKAGRRDVHSAVVHPFASHKISRHAATNATPERFSNSDLNVAIVAARRETLRCRFIIADRVGLAE
jgi:hypothetical protein